MNKRQINIAKNKISTSVEVITPELAAEWLETNVNNRLPTPKNINGLVHAMANGDWECNGEAIIFDENGNLTDGQHRLKAIVASGVTICSVVVRGTRVKSKDTINQGMIRTTGQVLDMDGTTEKGTGTAITAIVKAIHTYYELGFVTDHFGIRFTPRIVKDVLVCRSTIPTSYEFSKGFKRPVMTKALIGSLHYIFGEIDKEMGEIFLSSILTGDCKGDSEVLKLRNYFLDLKMNPKTAGRMKDRRFVAGVTIKAWNAWRKGETLKDFEYKKGDTFPTAR